MSIFHIMSAGLCASPIVSRNPRWFFPYSFLGFTLFFLVLLLEEGGPYPRISAWVLWLSGLLALVFVNPLWYQISFCLFMAAQVLNYGLRHSGWFAQLITVLGFLAFLAGVFLPLAIYVGVSALVILLLLSRRQSLFQIKEPSIES